MTITAQMFRGADAGLATAGQRPVATRATFQKSDQVAALALVIRRTPT